MALLDTGYRTLESEYESLLAPTQARPKAVLFGDSMSEYVGYNADGTPNTKYGNSIADVIGNNLGIGVENLATGGETSNEALVGGSKFGAFADYIAQNRPEYAIIRYGAADAIKNQDPNITLQSVQQMVDIARANGVTPIIVGVSELYGAQNSKTGNIAGYIDPGAEQRANAINAGLAQLAANNGLAFTDVRSAVSAGKGDLLDGVHTNADFGKKMADAISESIVEQGAIQGANVPQLPPNVDALSNEEKGRLYNQFIEQGFSDAQIRTAAKAESDQDWNALKQIAASVKNTTPATIERRAALGAAPAREQAAAGVSQSIADRLMAMPRNEFETVGFQEGGKDYSMDPNGLISVRAVGARPNDQVQVFDQSGNLLATHAVEQRSDFVQAINQAARVGIPAVIGAAILGPAGAGLLNAPAAAAVGSGGSTLLHGGSVEDALKAAALAGLTAYGLDYLTTTPELAQARELASSGMPEEAIVDTLISRGFSTNAAIEAASNATGLPAAGANRGLEFASTGAAPDVIVTGGSAVAPGITAAAPALAAIPAASQGLLTTGPVQQTQIEASRIDPDAASSILSSVLGQPISVAGSTQQVQVTGETPRQISQNEAAAVLSSLTGQQVQITGQTITGQQLNQTLPAAAGSLLQTVPVTGQNLPTTQLQTTAPAATAGLLTTAPTQQVETIGQRQVQVEDRFIPTITTAPTIPVNATESVQVQGKREPVPTATALVPAAAAGVTAPAQPTNITARDAALAGLLLAGAGSLGGGGQPGEPVSGPVSGVIPGYPGRGDYQMPGMFQIAPTNVYNPFATVAPFGAGRFGAVNQPITLPYGLLASGPIGLMAGINQPTRGLV